MPDGHVRLLAYNVRSLRDGRDDVAAVIRACEPDVVFVQEAPRFLRWRARRAALARLAGLVVVTGGRTAAGVLVLSSLRVRVVHAEDVRLSRTPRLHRRGVALAVLDVAGARVLAASLHLGLARAERLRHLDEIEHHVHRLATRYGAPHVVLGGDLNEPAGGRTWRRALDRLSDAYAAAPWGGEATFPAVDPSRRIDAVLTSADVHVARCGVPDVPGAGTASDHLPVLADVSLSPR